MIDLLAASEIWFGLAEGADNISVSDDFNFLR